MEQWHSRNAQLLNRLCEQCKRVVVVAAELCSPNKMSGARLPHVLQKTAAWTRKFSSALFSKRKRIFFFILKLRR